MIEIRRKNQLCMLPIMLLMVSVAMINPAVSDPIATVSAPSIVDTSLVPGESFTVDVDVADVIDLYGFDIKLGYDTSVLTATDIVLGDFFPPNSWIIRQKINDTAGADPPEKGGHPARGYAWLAVTLPLGTPEGIDGSGTLATVSFTVDALGATVLHLYGSDVTSAEPYTVLIMDINVREIDREVVDGFFANSALPPHDIAVTAVTASPTIVNVGEVVTIDVTVWNEGTETETFDVIVKYDDTEIETQTVTNLDSTRSETLSFSWDTTGMSIGEYVIKAVATVVEGEVDTADNTYVDGTISIIVPLQPPVAFFTWEPETPYVGENVTFDASASYDPDGTIVEYIWAFNDGTYLVETDPITTHVFRKAGIYRVSLGVIDNDGFYGFAQANVEVLSGVLPKLSGELDYFWKERVKIRLSALVRDAETMEPVSDANVTIQIYDPDGNL